MRKRDAQSQRRPRSDGEGYEKRDANAKWIFGIVIFLLIAGLAMHFTIGGMMSRLQKTATPADRWTGARNERTTPLLQARTAFPRLQISPPEDLRAFRAREEQELTNYAWINRTAGVVRIPIDRAMALLLERGVPTSNGTNGVKLGPSSYELQQQRTQFNQPEIQSIR